MFGPIHLLSSKSDPLGYLYAHDPIVVCKELGMNPTCNFDKDSFVDVQYLGQYRINEPCRCIPFLVRFRHVFDAKCEVMGEIDLLTVKGKSRGIMGPLSLLTNSFVYKISTPNVKGAKTLQLLKNYSITDLIITPNGKIVDDCLNYESVKKIFRKGRMRFDAISTGFELSPFVAVGPLENLIVKSTLFEQNKTYSFEVETYNFLDAATAYFVFDEAL